MKYAVEVTNGKPGLPPECVGMGPDEVRDSFEALHDKGIVPDESELLAVHEGWVHQNFVYRAPGGAVLVARFAKPDSAWRHDRKVRNGEYADVGLPSGVWRERRIAEEAERVAALKSKGLSVVEPPLFYDDSVAIYPFVGGALLDEMLRDSPAELSLAAYSAVLLEIHKAQLAGEVVGDRWGPNEKLTFKDGKIGGAVLFDHDLDVDKTIPELDLGTLTYYSARNAAKNGKASRVAKEEFGRGMGRLVGQVILSRGVPYDRALVRRIIEGHADHYSWRDPEGTASICEAALDEMGRTLRRGGSGSRTEIAAGYLLPGLA